MISWDKNQNEPDKPKATMKTILITGCSSGVGNQLVHKCLEQGFKVLATMRRAEERMSIFEKELEKYPDQLTIMNFDVISTADRSNIKEWIEKNWDGKLDVLVNNAGYGLVGALEDTNEMQWRQVFEVNVFGLVNLTRDMMPLLRAAKGRVINLSSVLGYLSMPMWSAYCASKFAVKGFTDSLAYEVRPHGVQVGCLIPGAYSTQFFENLDWSRQLTHLYDDQLESHINEWHLTHYEKGGDSDEVVNSLVSMINAKKMPVRKRVGFECNMFYYVQKFLPHRVLFLFMRAYFKARLTIKGAPEPN